jgi:hypothetical protein
MASLVGRRQEDFVVSQSSRRTRGASSVVRLALVAALSLIALAAPAGTAQALEPNGPDLDFILEQIKRSEAHAAGGDLLGPGPLQVHSPLLPYGLRTVDGRWNNLLPGGSAFGAADQLFPRLTTPVWRNGEPTDQNGPAPGGVTDTSYADKTDTFVGDKQPRIISNLIVDQSDRNPAAVEAAGGENPDADEENLSIPNVAPDTGLSSPFNSWFTLFGQFFDHGLDLTTKGGSGTVIVPLQPDDPLWARTPPSMRFMVLSRATNQKGDDGVLGTIDDVQDATNTTTSWVDQNQTYTSHPSHQVFLREYELVGGKPVATGKLLDNAVSGGLPTWADIKAQARQKLGIALDDVDVVNLPLVKTDQYGRFIPEPVTGFPQIVTSTAPDFDSGTPADPVDASDAVRTDHAFLDDIAHHAVPVGDLDHNPATPKDNLTADATDGTNDDRNPATYDDEMLDKHFITGDGRGNENIGLTAVHHVFHAEHNLRVDEIKTLIEKPGAPEPADWQLPNGDWSGERLFQAARFITEMEYQHLVFEEFARKVQPQVNVFAGYEADIDPSIVAEFAHTVYRFGHSMLTESVDRTNADGSKNDIGLIQAFLNPEEFHDGGPAGTLDSRKAAGAIVRGMVRQRGNEIDEFVTGALRNNLVGLPLDLATINIARGREAGVPGLNAARRQFHAATSDSALAPYESWDDFKHGIRHPESLVNFIAAYGRHPSIESAATVAEKRAAADAIVNGDDDPGTPAPDRPADAEAFLNGPAASTGVEDIDFWIGGLAEKQMPFGGLLGSSFNFVFETQMEKLQDGDRFYYLHRTAGLNFLTQLEENSFAEMIMRTTDTKHLPADVFSRPDFIFEIAKVGNTGPVLDDDSTEEDEREVLTRNASNTTRFAGPEHVLFGGTEEDNRIHSSEGDDTIWADGGNDRVEGGAGNDAIEGGAGDDILTDLFGDDNLKGGTGDDAINAGSGLDLLLGGAGADFVFAGEDPKETFGGDGGDFIDAGDSADIVFGDEGDDWIEGGGQADLLQGEHGAPFQDGREGDDVIDGNGGNDDYDSEGGDDVMIAGPGIDRHEGMIGFDWVTHKNDPEAADSDLNFTGLLPPDEENVRDRFDNVEGLSGWNRNDVLRGDEFDAELLADHQLENPGLFPGLDGVLGDASSFTGGNIIIGGAGSDILEGRGGNDVLDGDHWLDVEISVRDANDPSVELERVDRMRDVQARIFDGTLKPSQLRIVRQVRKAAPDANDIDTAVFSGNRADYDFVPGPSTTKMTVVHARGTLVDGTDTVRNVERLQFADQTLVIDPTLHNEPPTGTVDLDVANPVEDQQITATEAFDDADGIQASSIRFAWQAEVQPGVWASAGDGKSWAPGDESVGAPVRVVATFRDNDGVLESVSSDPTDPVQNVNDAPTGRPTVTATAPQSGREISVLTAPINDADGMANAAFTYQWQQQIAGGFSNIGGATGSTYTPGAGQVGRELRVVVSYTDDNGTAERVNSSATDPVAGASIAPVLLPAVPTSKSNGAAPAPTPAGGAGAGSAPSSTGATRPSAQRPAARRLTVSRLRVRKSITKGPIAVTADVPAGAKVVRIKVARMTKVRGKARRQLVGTVFRTVRRSGRQTFRLTERKLMRLKPGSYVVEVRAGTARTELGSARTAKMSVKRARRGATRRGGAASLLPMRLPLLG